MRIASTLVEQLTAAAQDVAREHVSCRNVPVDRSMTMAKETMRRKLDYDGMFYDSVEGRTLLPHHSQSNGAGEGRSA